MLNNIDNKCLDRDKEEQILRKLDLQTNYLMNDWKWMFPVKIKKEKIVNIDINRFLKIGD